MKLLPKKQVQSLVEDQRRIQIDEGVTLARKIDALREKLADLQRQHDLFVMGMEDNLKAKTQGLFELIQEKEAEIKLLEVKRQELLKPLDMAWKAVEIRETELNNLKADLEIDLANLNRKEESIDKKNNEAKTILSHIKVRERELERTFDKAEQLRIEAEKGYLKMSNEKDKQDKKFEERNRALDLAESAIKSYQFTLSQRQEQIEMREKKNEAEVIRLKDKEATLERAFNRIRKKL